MIRALLFSLFLVNIPASAQTKIAVIDAGFDSKYKNKVKLCKTGHWSFDDKPFKDPTQHGTHVVGLIHKYAKKKNYCVVMLRYYADENPGSLNLKNMVLALKRARRMGVEVVNISGGGPTPSVAEKNVIQSLLDDGVKIVAAAGNEKEILNEKTCNYYPACYDSRIIVVGNIAKTSNRGPVVDYWVRANDVRSLNGRMGGTSQAAAIITGKIVGGISLSDNEADSDIEDELNRLSVSMPTLVFPNLFRLPSIPPKYKPSVSHPGRCKSRCTRRKVKNH